MTTYIALVLFIFVVFLLIKNENTYRMRMKVNNAIHRYRMFCIYNAPDKTEDINIFDKEPYWKTLWRLWDWGDKRIVSAEKYELIKEFLAIEEREI